MKHNPNLLPSILEFLLQHLTSLVDIRKEISFPLKFSKILLDPNHHSGASSSSSSASFLTEPLGELLMVLTFCTTVHSQESMATDVEDGKSEELSHLVQKYADVISGLADKLSYCDWEDICAAMATAFQLNSDTNSNKVSRACLLAEFMCGVLDALIEYFIRLNQSQVQIRETERGDCRQKLIDIIKTRKRIASNLKEQLQKSKSKKVDQDNVSVVLNNDSIKSILGLEVCVFIVKNGMESLKNGSDTQLSRKDEALINFEAKLIVLSAMDYWVKCLSLNPFNFDVEAVLVDLVSCQSALFHECCKHFDSNRTDELESKESTILKQYLQSLYSIFELFSKHFKIRVSHMIKTMAGKAATTSSITYSEALFQLTKKANKILQAFVSCPCLYSLGKDGGIVLITKIISLLSKEMTVASRDIMTKQHGLLDSMCRSSENENLRPAAELLVKCLLSANEMSCSTSSDSRLIARDIHYNLGDSESDVVLDGTPIFNLITETTARQIIVALTAHCEEVLKLIEMTVRKIKALWNYEGGANLMIPWVSMDKALSQKLVIVAQVLNELLHSDIPKGAPQEAVLRLTSGFFVGLKSYVILCTDLFRVKPGDSEPFLSDRFEKLVRLCGSTLKENVFSMVTYIFNKQCEAFGSDTSSDVGGAAGKKTNAPTQTQVGRESKLVSNLVFSIESYEKELVVLTKKSKVDLVSGTKITTSRDFRIRVETLQRALEDITPTANSSISFPENGKNERNIRPNTPDGCENEDADLPSKRPRLMATESEDDSE